MSERTVNYLVDGETFEGFVAVPEGAGPFPGVLICHAWMGQGAFERDKARALAALGYVALAADVYGTGNRATDADGARALMGPLVGDRTGALKNRLHASVSALAGLPEVDSAKMSAIGYCFGGLCVLDLARSGAPLVSVVSFHGNLSPQDFEYDGARPKVLVCHGYDDPMVVPETMVGFCDEMKGLGVDWMLHAYGGTVHSFTNPAANNPTFGTVYNEAADRRSWWALQGFLSETLGA